jgi:uncharacterized membrane protein
MIKYLLKIWATTCFISPLVIILLNLKRRGYTLENFIESFSYCLVFGLVSSLPSIIILYIISRKISTNKNLKLILSIISVILVFATFYLVGFNLSDISDLILPTVYSIIMVCNIWFFKNKNNVA